MAGLGFAFCLLASAVGGSGDARAQAFYCSKPQVPYCLDSFGTFEGEWSFNNCRSQMQSYVSDVERYSRCLYDAAESEADEIRREANDAVDRFNCKAEGNSFCM